MISPRRRSRSARSSAGGRGQLPTVVTGKSGRLIPRRRRRRSSVRASPGLEPLQIHHLPVRWVPVVHRQQHPGPRLRPLGGQRRRDGEVAVVEGVGGGEHPDALGVGGAVPAPQVPVQVQHRGRVGAALDQVLERLALAAHVVAVLAHQQVVASQLVVGAGAQARALEVMDREQRRLRRVAGPDRDHATAQIGQASHRRIAVHQQMGPPVAIGVPHRQRPAPAPAAALRVHPRQRRVPRDVDVSGQQGIHLQLVVRVVHAVHRQIVAGEEAGDDVPDHRHLRVVDHGPHQDRSHEALLHGTGLRSMCRSAQRWSVAWTGARASVRRQRASRSSDPASALT